MDRFGDRNQLLFNVESLIEFHKTHEREASSGQFNLFAVASTTAVIHLHPAPPAPKREMLSWEKELLGLYISEHPYREYRDRLEGVVIPISELPNHKKSKSVRTAGVITTCKKILTKKNEMMAFVGLEDGVQNIEVVVFPRVLKELPTVWNSDTLVVVTGRVQEKDGEWKMLAETAYEITPENIDDIRADGTRKPLPSLEMGSEPVIELFMRATLPDSVLRKLRVALDTHPGSLPVVFVIEDEEGVRRVKTSTKASFTEQFVFDVEHVIGKGTVKSRMPENVL